MISHVVVLSCFYHSRHPIRLVTIVQYRVWHRSHLYDQSDHCSIWFSTQRTLNSIGHNNSVLFSAYTAPIWLITSLFYHFFIKDHTQLDRSWQFSFSFGVDQTNTINHVTVLFGFNHKLHPVRSIIKAQFHFQGRSLLYDRSGHSPVWFSLQIAPN